jgi:hypothetical protein
MIFLPEAHLMLILTDKNGEKDIMNLMIKQFKFSIINILPETDFAENSGFRSNPEDEESYPV